MHLCIIGCFVTYNWQIVCSRALVDEDHVKPITTDFKQLGIKKTPAFDRAYKELRHHQELVEASLKGRSSLTKFQNKLADSKKNDIISTDHPVNSPNPKQPSRKRKSSTPITPQDKPSSVKRPASVPLKKNKKFYQDSPTSSSPKNTSQVLLHFLRLLFYALFFDIWWKFYKGDVMIDFSFSSSQYSNFIFSKMFCFDKIQDLTVRF